MSKSINYQPHIDGLRAIAVLSVLVFHLDKSWLPGGFVGVDIFFVISGYLITSILTREIDQKRFSLKHFYTRRIKRILPVYFTVAASSLITGIIILAPSELIKVAESLLASVVFLSNYYFYFNVGYFGGQADLMPLIHMWSLAVEEQFYIFWPIVLTFLAAIASPLWRIVFIWAIFLSSFVISLMLSSSHPDFSYYAIMTRTYELMVGALFAIYMERAKALPKVSIWMAFAALILSVIFIRQSMAFPGWIALIPCVATGVLIVKGQESSGVYRLLSAPFMVWVGLLSYSLYMWHWPVISFMRHYFIDLEMQHILFATVGMFALSMISRHLIEKPMMKSGASFKRSFLLLYLLPASILVGVSWLIISSDGVYSRYSNDEQMLLRTSEAVGHHCARSLPYDTPNPDCLIGEETTEPKAKVLLWGDSHANHFFNTAKVASKSMPVTFELVSFAGCPSIRGVFRVNRAYSVKCYEHNEAVWEKLVENGDFDAIVLASNWANYPRGNNLGDNEDMSISIENSSRAFFRNMSNMISDMALLEKQFFIIDSVPNFPFNPARCNINRKLLEQNRDCNLDESEYKQGKADFTAFIMQEVNGKRNVSFVSLDDALCDEGICLSEKDGKALYSDSNHLSEYGSKYVASEFISFLNEVATK